MVRRTTQLVGRIMLLDRYIAKHRLRCDRRAHIEFARRKRAEALAQLRF